MPGAFRLAASIGDTPAIVAQMIRPPATGDIERPKAPPIAAILPMSMAFKPNLTASGVTALLNATAAASPEPL